MDSHHQLVTLAQAKADPAPRAYFAYSTILDREAFDAWKAEHGYQAFQLPAGELAQAVDVALVYDFPSRWWGGRVAGLADAPGQAVWGVLFQVPGTDWPIVQHKEGGVTGMSVERPVTVHVGGRAVQATAFATNPLRRDTTGPISERFVQALVRGATSAGLPAAWTQGLPAAAK